MSVTRKLINDLDKSWSDILNRNFAPSDIDFVDRIYNDELTTVYPPREKLFEAFKHFTVSETKVVILGQDPYYSPGLANGLAFSVPDGEKIPASLRNIFVELRHEYPELIECPQLKCGNLIRWAKQGVLLLNTALTVEDGKPNIYSKEWRKITDGIIKDISDSVEGCVFLLWGGNAHKKSKLIDNKKHFVFKCSHPSPLAAHRGNWFYNSQFMLCNTYLKKKGKKEIEWLYKVDEEKVNKINDI